MILIKHRLKKLIYGGASRLSTESVETVPHGILNVNSYREPKPLEVKPKLLFFLV